MAGRQELWLLALASAIALFSRGLAQQESRCSLNGTDCGLHSSCSQSLVCQCDTGYASLLGTNCKKLDLSCHATEKDCGKCDGDICTKCVDGYYVTPSSGECVTSCPADDSEFVLSGARFLGSICNLSTGGGLSTTIIIVICVIVAILVIVVIVVIVIVRMKGRARGFWSVNDPAPQDNQVQMRQSSSSTSLQKAAKRESKRISKELEAQVNQGFEGETPSGDELEEFLRRLSKLKNKATAFLAILNDMRRKLRTLPADSDSAMKYKKVVKDLTRLLFLLNKKPKSIKMPSDGLHLLTWAEHLLSRFQETNPEKAKEVEEAGVTMTDEEMQKKIEDETHF
eukprot:m.7459 g.7459  ORF g.7459 m.7459 type:complete len:340 (+) comp18718_c0_seq1:83-1102(+)